MTTATKITFVRVFLIPVFVILMMMGSAPFVYAALAVFIIASLTDFVDGYIARHYNQVTNLGKFLDPLADKLLVTAAMLIFVEWGQFPAWAALTVLTREFAVQGLRLVAVERGSVIAAAWSGKVKTASTMVCLCIMTVLSVNTFPMWKTVNTACIAVIVITTVYSGVEYFMKNMHVFSENSK